MFTLTPSESKRLLAKAVVQMPEVKAAWETAYLLLAGGTTNAFLAQELLGDRSIAPARCAVGLSTNGLLCVTDPATRTSFPNVFYHGQPQPEMTLSEALADYHPQTVIIKGANAVDTDGYVGVIASGFDGGVIPRLIGAATSKGLTWITPVGLEKLVPSVQAAARALGGASRIDISMGADPGMYCLGTTTVVTELEAISILFGCEAALVCCGGVGGNEGAVTLAVDGEAPRVQHMVEYLEANIKGEPPVPGNKGTCARCRYRFCRYCGLRDEELPVWLQGREGTEG